MKKFLLTLFLFTSIISFSVLIITVAIDGLKYCIHIENTLLTDNKKQSDYIVFSNNNYPENSTIIPIP